MEVGFKFDLDPRTEGGVIKGRSRTEVERSMNSGREREGVRGPTYLLSLSLS